MKEEERQRLTWEDATQRFLKVAELGPEDRQSPLEAAVDTAYWNIYNNLTGAATAICGCRRIRTRCAELWYHACNHIVAECMGRTTPGLSFWLQAMLLSAVAAHWTSLALQARSSCGSPWGPACRRGTILLCLWSSSSQWQTRAASLTEGLPASGRCASQPVRPHDDPKRARGQSFRTGPCCSSCCKSRAQTARCACQHSITVRQQECGTHQRTATFAALRGTLSDPQFDGWQDVSSG